MGINIFWPDLTFPPINLLSAPNMTQIKRNTEADRRARSLRLVNPPRPKSRSQVVISPARGIGASLQAEQIMDCIARRNGGRR